MSVARPPAWPMGEIVALDVGGTAVKCGVVQGASNAGWLRDVRHVARQPIDSAASAEAIADRLADIANGLLAQCRDPAFVVLALLRALRLCAGHPAPRGPGEVPCPVRRGPQGPHRAAAEPGHADPVPERRGRRGAG